MQLTSSGANPYVASNVSVFHAERDEQQSGIEDYQEFLVVHAAPEVDPTVAARLGISLLLGGVLVLRGRRKLARLSAAPAPAAGNRPRLAGRTLAGRAWPGRRAPPQTGAAS